MNIAITCTGARSEAFALCQQYMLRQTLKPDLWIIVDDCEPKTATPLDEINCAIITPDVPYGQYPEPNTQHRNMLIAMNYLAIYLSGFQEDVSANIFFIEDDDWFAPDYIEKQAHRLDSHPLVGETPARYYHVGHRTHRTFTPEEMAIPTPHASLCATAIRSEMIHAVREACECRAWIDMYLWRVYGGKGALYEDSSVVGIKGMPGRPGISQVHRNLPDPRWTGDPDLSKLREWIGADADNYARFAIAHEEPVQRTPAPDPSGFETFIGYGGQKRYRCPHCPIDHWDPNYIGKHWVEQHQELPTPNTKTLLDEGPDQITRPIYVPK